MNMPDNFDMVTILENILMSNDIDAVVAVVADKNHKAGNKNDILG